MVYYVTVIARRHHRISRPVGGLRFDAGSLSLNLVATVGRRFGERVERLDSPAHLSDWLSGVGLAVSEALSDEDLACVKVLREHLDELFRCALAATRPPAVALEHVNVAVAGAVPRLRTTSAGVALARPTAGSRALEPVLTLIAADAVRIVAGSERLDLRRCQADDCRMLYLAHDRRVRRWCSAERCGNRTRVAAHRARAAGLDRR